MVDNICMLTSPTKNTRGKNLTREKQKEPFLCFDLHKKEFGRFQVIDSAIDHVTELSHFNLYSGCVSFVTIFGLCVGMTKLALIFDYNIKM
eukprot:c21082_g1_i1 orf=564-836(+)